MKRSILFILLFCSSSFISFAQTYNIVGTIISGDEKLPLPGVSIVEKGTTNGTSSDIKGNFRITVSAGSTIQISFVGYNKQEIVVSDDKPLSITLEPESAEIDELVVIGYGTVKKSDLTGSVSSVSSTNIKQSKVSGIDQAIQGRAAGVTVTANSGQPGAGVTVRIRGIGTVNNSDPLYVVDGVALTNISFLNPSDIKSMEILKDASATAIYGARGANGVILITTLKGEQSTKMNTTFDYYTGVQSKWRTLDLMNREQYAKFVGYDPSDPLYTSFSDWVYKNYQLNTNPYIPTDINYENYDTDWQNVIFRDNARVSNYHFSANGGNKLSTYAFSLGYFDQDGIIISSNFKRFTFRVNSTHKLNDYLKVGENLSITNSNSRGVATNNENYSVLNSAISFAPWDPVRYPDGRITPSTTTNLVNPISMVENQHPKNEWNRLVGNVFFEITPISGLTFKSDIGTDGSYGSASNFKPKYDISQNDKMQYNFLEHSYQKYFMWQWENTLTYHKVFRQKHDLTLLAGMTAQEGNWDILSATKESIPNESSNLWYLDAATRNATAGGRAWEWSMLSYLGRVQYSYNSRYLLTFNIRRDGSSRFGVNNRWGVFPSLALGWKINDEEFFQPFKTYINTLKLRAGWGRIGNQEIGNYAYTPLVTTGSTFVGYVFGDTQTLENGAAPLTNPNKDLKWETTEQTNFGIDFSVLSSKLSMSVDYFIKDTKDMLVAIPVPAHVGVRYYSMQNAGTVRNKGIELTAEYKQDLGDFSFSVGGNISSAKNEVISLGGGEDIYAGGFKGENLTRTRVGDPIGSFYGYKINGIFQDKYDVEEYVNSNGVVIQPLANPGDYRIVDQNDDGKIDVKDKVNLGNPFPKFTYGLNAIINYKSFDFQMFFQGVYGNKIYNCNKYFLEGDGSTNLSVDMLNAWSGKGTSNTLVNPRTNKDPLNLSASSKFIEDGSYLRLKTIQLGYTLPSKLTKKSGLTNLHIYISATNLLTFTKYSGFDPEIGVTNGLDMGVDRGNYPQARTYTIGATVNL